ncbi:MAG TPA: hypothetical protein VEG37_04410 [Burkholderiales bacterium]|nr:hypothetical protein [Burkholderiales bacterium]
MSEFRGYLPLMAFPDPRRLDIFTSLRDPFEEWKVRVFSQNAAIPVYLIADLSASMGFNGALRKLDVLADLTASLGYSAYRTGDAFSFIGCDETVRKDLMLPLTYAKNAGVEWSEKLRVFQATGKSANGLLEARDYLGNQRALVLLVSDFHFPLDFLQQVLGSLSRHQIVPIMLWDEAESERLPASGIARVQDSETGGHRVLWMRPLLREKTVKRFEQRRQALEHVFATNQIRPFFLTGAFKAERLTDYFFSGAASAGA